MCWALCQVFGLILFNLQNYFHSTKKEPETEESKSNWFNNAHMVKDRAGASAYKSQLSHQPPWLPCRWKRWAIQREKWRDRAGAHTCTAPLLPLFLEVPGKLPELPSLPTSSWDKRVTGAHNQFMVPADAVSGPCSAPHPTVYITPHDDAGPSEFPWLTGETSY